MTNTTHSVLLQINSAQLKHQVQKTVESAGSFSIREMTPDARGDLLIMELGPDSEKDFQHVQKLLDTDYAGQVFLLSDRADQDILLRSIRAGVKEFFTLPLQEEELIQALDKFKNRKKSFSGGTPEPKQGKIITVMGSKGGSGTTTIAINLAAALAEKHADESILLLDLNLDLSEIPLFLNFTHQYNWGDLARNIRRMDETFLRDILFKHATGISILPGPEYVNGQAMEFQEIFQQMLQMLRRMFSAVIIDAGHSLQGLARQCASQSDTVLVISQLSLTQIAGAGRLLGALGKAVDKPEDKLKVIINRYEKKTDLNLNEARESLKTDIFWTVPNDYRFAMTAINQGRTFGQISSRHRLARNMQDLAARLLPPAESGKQSRRRWFFL